jgi:hypothetical protein
MSERHRGVESTATALVTKESAPAKAGRVLFLPPRVR